jgi:hypothetical protein
MSSPRRESGHRGSRDFRNVFVLADGGPNSLAALIQINGSAGLIGLRHPDAAWLFPIIIPCTCR